MPDARATPPTADELEVSVFGYRKGECIVVHVPNGPWFVVDSMAVYRKEDRVAIATAYLCDCLHVTEVYGVFLTHWHDDHTAAAGQLIRQFGPKLAMVGLPISNSSRELMSYVADLVPNEQRAALVKDLLSVISVLGELTHVQVVTIQDRTQLAPSGATWRLDSLSPSFDDARHQAATLVSFLPGFVGPPPISFDVNSGCAVLRLEVDGIVVLFQSDLDVGDSPTRGWQNIHRVYQQQLSANIVKIGHHGSHTAFHLPSWNAISAANKPHGAVTPYPARGVALPRAKEIAQLKRHCARIHLAGVQGASNQAGAVPLKRTPFTEYAPTSASFSKAAQVRYRMRPGEANPRVEVFPPAREL
jgi:hypothetical protein